MKTPPVYMIVLIAFFVLTVLAAESENPTENLAEIGAEQPSIDPTINLPIPILSDAIAVLDHDDDVAPLVNSTNTMDQEEESEAEAEYYESEFTDDGLIQINPDYQDDQRDADFLGDSKGSVKISNYTIDETKSRIGQALANGPKKFNKFVNRHRIKLTVALVVIAFRREIQNLLWGIISKPVHDPQTGKLIGRQIQPLTPTMVLKMWLIIHSARRLHRFSEGDSNNPERSLFTPAWFLFTGQIFNFGAWLMSDMLSPANPAYIPPTQQHYTFERINHRYQKDVQAYTKAVLDEKVTVLKLQQLVLAHRRLPNMTNSERAHMMYKQLHQQGESATRFSNAVTSSTLSPYNSTIVIMDWTELDSSLSKLDILRDEVSFLIHCHDGLVTEVDHHDQQQQSHNQFEVVVLLESPGGSASEYALAAQQIIRLRQSGIPVTICVDKVAASGGYMIACTSSPGQLLAAPFAVLGSIGVIGQSVNIHKLLEGWGITPLVFRGGKDKAPVGLIGEITRAGMNKVQNMVDDTHRAFKRHVAECRPIIANRIDRIATGDIWLGYDALHVGLIDRVVTSDEYLGERIRSGARILKLLKIVRGRSIFSKPQTEVLSQINTQDVGNDRNEFDFMSTFRSFLDKAQQRALQTLLSNDNLSPATRTPTLQHAKISVT